MMRGIWEENMGILTYFWVIEHVHVYRDLFNIILGVMRPHLQMDYYVRATRRSSSTTLTTIVEESPGIETFSYVSSNVTIIRHYRAGGWVGNISIDHSSNKSEMSRGGRQPLLITQIHSRNTVEDVFEKYS